MLFTGGSSTQAGGGLTVMFQTINPNGDGVVPDSANSRLNIAAAGGATSQCFPNCYIQPRLLGPLSGLAQYVQCKIVSNNSNNLGNPNTITTRGGIAVLGTGYAYGGYILYYTTNGVVSQMSLYSGGGSIDATGHLTPLVNLVPGMPFAVGDVIRLECRPGIASCELLVFSNGVQVGAYSDVRVIAHGAVAGRPPYAGIPSYYFSYQLRAGLQTMTNFKAGAL